MDINEIREAKMILTQTIGDLVGQFSMATDVIVRVRVVPKFVDVTAIGDDPSVPRRQMTGYMVEVEGEI